MQYIVNCLSCVGYLPVVLIMILMVLPIQIHNNKADSNREYNRLTIIGVATLDLATRSFKSITTPSCYYTGKRNRIDRWSKRERREGYKPFIIHSKHEYVITYSLG